MALKDIEPIVLDQLRFVSIRRAPSLSNAINCFKCDRSEVVILPRALNKQSVFNKLTDLQWSLLLLQLFETLRITSANSTFNPVCMGMKDIHIASEQPVEGGRKTTTNPEGNAPIF